jgi:hypothetical protein
VCVCVCVCVCVWRVRSASVIVNHEAQSRTVSKRTINWAINPKPIYSHTLLLYLCGVHPAVLLTYTIQTYNIKYTYGPQSQLTTCSEDLRNKEVVSCDCRPYIYIYIYIFFFFFFFLYIICLYSVHSIAWQYTNMECHVGLSPTIGK